MTRRWLALGLVAALAVPAWAKGDKKAKQAEKDDDAADSTDDDSDTSDKDDDKPDKKPDKRHDKKTKNKKADTKDKKADAKDKKADKKKSDDAESDDDKGSDDADSDADAAPDEKGALKTKKTEDDSGDTKGAVEPVKQDLTGHDLGTKKKANEFERDRFFVDKTDSKDTENGTLIQGSITSSSFAYHESSGNFANLAGTGANGSGLSRLFTDLRLQTDFRHIRASRWEARIDARIRVVNGEAAASEPQTAGAGATPPPATNIQSGLTGQDEYELRELWLIRNGERTDVIIGRQFITDLAAVKIDGVRIDYASSNRLTYLGFAGLYPLRGSRSLSTDYIESKDPTTGAPLSAYTGSAGFGAAYRTPTAYGAFGGVALVPFPGEGEQARIFATSNGYYRVNPKLDLYHFALIDLVAAAGAQVTNLSAGANYKPTQRLRMTASYNRVDTDSLNIQAQAFLDTPQANPVIQNNLFLQRLATNQARGSISAGLGANERFEITFASSYRSRPGINLTTVGATATTFTLPAARGAEVYGSITDRYSIKGARIGVDAVETFGVGDVAYQRDETTAYRAFAARDLDSGHGEWEAEVSYASNNDKNGAGAICNSVIDPVNCYGSTKSNVLSAGGTLYYRFNRDWFLIASAYLSHTVITVDTMPADSAINGFTGYLRFSHRF